MTSDNAIAALDSIIFLDLGVWRSAKFVKTKFSSGKSEITIKKVSPLRGELIIFGVGLSECGLKEPRHSDVRESEKCVSGLGIAAHDNLPIKYVNFIVRCNNLMKKKR